MRSSMATSTRSAIARPRSSSRCARDGVRYLGVTIMPGPQLQQAVPDIKRIKAACPELIVIVGGYFPTNHVNTCSKDPMIDYVVLSAGEDTLLELLDTLEAGGDPATVAGLAFERDGKVIQTPQAPAARPERAALVSVRQGAGRALCLEDAPGHAHAQPPQQLRLPVLLQLLRGG